MSDNVLSVGSLFSGIGGLELGLEMTGRFRTVWQVEQNEYCRKVLARHWPAATRFEDVRNVGRENLAPVDVICGGFPCQDISNAGRQAGITVGTRSGLWYEYARIVRELRPRYVVVENVAALLARGLDVVLGELSESGYDAEWSVLSAADVGAPHLRERIFVVAYAQSDRRAVSGERHEGRNDSSSGIQRLRVESRGDGSGVGAKHLADGQSVRRGARGPRRLDTSGAWESEQSLPDVAHANRQRCEASGPRGSARVPASERPQHHETSALPSHRTPRDRWSPEPDVGRVAHGVPNRVDRLRALGNAVVPQCAQVVGKWLLEIHDSSQFPTPEAA